MKKLIKIQIKPAKFEINKIEKLIMVLEVSNQNLWMLKTKFWPSSKIKIWLCPKIMSNPIIEPEIRILSFSKEGKPPSN